MIKYTSKYFFTPKHIWTAYIRAPRKRNFIEDWYVRRASYLAKRIREIARFTWSNRFVTIEWRDIESNERNVSKTTMRLEMDARVRRSCTKARRIWHIVGLGVNTARICDGRHGQPSGWVLNASNGENRARTSWPSNGRRKSYLRGVKDSYILTAHLTPHTIFHDESSRSHWKDLWICLCLYVIKILCSISISRIFFGYQFC